MARRATVTSVRTRRNKTAPVPVSRSRVFIENNTIVVETLVYAPEDLKRGTRLIVRAPIHLVVSDGVTYLDSRLDHR